ncbi:MAG: hypothetical protein ABSF50_17390 [Burkholderiaceae bacterium]
MNESVAGPVNGDFARYIEELTQAQQARLLSTGTVELPPPADGSAGSRRPRPAAPPGQPVFGTSSATGPAAKTAPSAGSVARGPSLLVILAVFVAVALLILGMVPVGLFILAAAVIGNALRTRFLKPGAGSSRVRSPPGPN